MAEAAKSLDFSDFYTYGAAAPAGAGYAEPTVTPEDIPSAQELPRPKEHVAVRRTAGVSLFAIFGSVFVGILMIFTMLAQINYNEVASQAVDMDSQISALTEQQRKLEITFESVVDMKEVERYARDELGMSKPEAEQVTVIQGADDKAEIIDNNNDDNALRGFGSFISSLVGYFKQG